VEVFKRVHRGYDELQLDVLGHDRHSNWRGWRTSWCPQTDRPDNSRSPPAEPLEAQISLEVLCNLTHQALERQLADQQLGRLLVATDLTKCHSSRLVTMWILHSAGRWSALAGSLRRQLLPRRLSTGRLSSCLLRTSHSYLDDQHILLIPTINVF